jgi:peptidoglycan/xylan/chitin deacetylase (PgdA/CDA1 family)
MLTFDGGPDPKFTPLVLDLLRHKKAKATFFVEGRKALQYPVLIRHMVRDGHEVGVGSWDSASYDLSGASEEGAVQLRSRFVTLRDQVTNITGVPVRLMRPPLGLADEAFAKVASSARLSTVLWSVELPDNLPGQEPLSTLAKTKAQRLQPGDIVFVAGSWTHKLAALPFFLQSAYDKGFEFVPISLFLQFPNDKPH